MGKASRKKHFKKQQAAALEMYDGVKLSEALIAICEPYDYEDSSIEEYNKLMTMTVVAWNIANLPEEKRHEQLLGFINTMPTFKEELETDFNYFMDKANSQEEPPASIVFLQILSSLMHRKIELYPNDDRIVMDFKVKETKTDRHVSVTSKMPAAKRQFAN